MGEVSTTLPRIACSTMAYDLQLKGCTTFRPNPNWTLCARIMRRRGASLLHVWSGRSDQEVAMKIESTTFGTIAIDGTTYQHDVVVRLSGEIVSKKKKLSKKL